MKGKLAILAVATTLTLAPITSANAAERMSDPSICFKDWHGVIYSTEVRGHVVLQVFGENGRTASWRYYDTYRTVAFWPHEHITGTEITGVARVAPKSTDFADVRSVNAGCTIDQH